MSWWQTIVLAVLQGLTEFLPVSSSGHLAIASRVFFSGDAGASFTAVTQLGTEAAVLIYFAKDIWRILVAWFSGLTDAARRTADYWLGWWVIIGTIPICVLGLLFKDQIRSGARNLWVIATAMIVFSAVIALAEYVGRQTRDVEQLTWKDSVIVGLAQCLALIPGVSRSGASIVAAMLFGADKRAAAEFSFFLAIPTMVGAFAYDFYKSRGEMTMDHGLVIAVGFVVSFITAIIVVKTFLDFVTKRGFALFAWWRVVVGTLGLIALALGK